MGENEAAESGEMTPAPVGNSIADEIAAIHAGLEAEREPEVFELPGYGRRLMVEYRVLSNEEQEEISEKIAEQIRSKQIENPVFMGLIDNLIQGCIRFVREVDGEVVPLHEALGGEETGAPIRWGDDRLADLVRLPRPETGKLRARAIVRGVLADDRLVQSHAQEVTRWMERSLSEVRTDFTTASSATAA